MKTFEVFLTETWTPAKADALKKAREEIAKKFAGRKPPEGVRHGSMRQSAAKKMKDNGYLSKADKE